MFILDSLLIGGLRFVLDQVATVADQELNDEGRLREHLLENEMRFELAEISREEFNATEASILSRLREIREIREGGEQATPASEGYRISGAEVSFGGDETA